MNSIIWFDLNIIMYSKDIDTLETDLEVRLLAVEISEYENYQKKMKINQ